jgi:hypothetical protein
MTLFEHEIQRLRFRQGQMLRSDDFRDQAAIEAQLRWWHNRALHNAYGVIHGFAVELRQTAGQWIAHVAPGSHIGLAYDCFGRELVLLQPQTIALPDPPAASNDQPAMCDNNTLTGQPTLFWKTTGTVSVRDGVVLARVVFGADGTPALDQQFDAPLARPLARPRIGSGATVPGSTAWEPWYIDESAVARRLGAIGVQTTIDTAAAGFTDVPCYFATLQGSLWNRSHGTFMPAPLTHITAESAHAFTFRIWLPSLPIRVVASQAITLTNDSFRTNFLTFVQQQRLFVSWLGIGHEG